MSSGGGERRVVRHEYAPIREKWSTKNNQKKIKRIKKKEKDDDEDIYIYRRNCSRTI